jgi:hypothetical protein
MAFRLDRQNPLWPDHDVIGGSLFRHEIANHKIIIRQRFQQTINALFRYRPLFPSNRTIGKLLVFFTHCFCQVVNFHTNDHHDRET